MEPIHQKIGRNLYRIRRERGLSLGKLAEITGVSKAMLGQIERGESNPTISILWKISGGLHISFSSLIEEQSSEVSVQHIDQLQPLLSAEGKYRSYPLYPFDPRKQLEVYAVEMDAGCIHHSEAHLDGVEEMVFVYEGELQIKISDEEYVLPPGSSIRFSAGLPHVYINLAETVTRYYALIYYPS